MARPAEPPTLRRFLVVSLLLAAVIAIAANIVLQATGLEGPSWLLGWLYALASAFVVGAFLALILLKPRDRRIFDIVGLRETIKDEDEPEDVVVAEVAGRATGPKQQKKH